MSVRKNGNSSIFFAMLTAILVIHSTTGSAENSLSDTWQTYPGLIDELNPGTELKNGLLAGEYEAVLFIYKNEKPLYDQIIKLNRKEFRTKYAVEISWFQRVGNFRKQQKCDSISKMQSEFKLSQSKKDDCINNILRDS